MARMAALPIPEIKSDSCWGLWNVEPRFSHGIGSTESGGMFSHGTHCKILWRFDYRGGIHGAEPRMFSHGTQCKIPWRFDYRVGIHGTEPRMFSHGTHCKTPNNR